MCVRVCVWCACMCACVHMCVLVCRGPQINHTIVELTTITSLMVGNYWSWILSTHIPFCWLIYICFSKFFFSFRFSLPFYFWIIFRWLRNSHTRTIAALKQAVLLIIVREKVYKNSRFFTALKSIHRLKEDKNIIIDKVIYFFKMRLSFNYVRMGNYALAWFRELVNY